jgi:hypothetical protein
VLRMMLEFFCIPGNEHYRNSIELKSSERLVLVSLETA